MSEAVKLDMNFFIAVVKDMARLTEENRNYWTKLDSDIGDGDHGINLSIGFRAVTQYLDELDVGNTDIKSFLKKVGMTLLGKVGGASGPLYGTLFMKMSKPLTDEQEASLPQFVDMLIEGIEGVKARGKAVVGDKTMVDTLEPALTFLKENRESFNKEKVQQLIERMQAGAESTIPLVAKKGRAMRLGERAIGHKDPGAESSWMLFNVIATHLEEKLA